MSTDSHCQFHSVGDWYETARKEGYSVPLEMCRGLETVMEKYQMTFPKAFELLERNEKILLEGKTYVYDLSPIELDTTRPRKGIRDLS